MTKYAKWMVFANTALSFIFMAWSIGLFMQQMPWQDYVTPEGPQPGKIKVFANRIKELVDARDKADARWYTATKEVIRLDVEIPKRRAFYAEQIKMATTGTDAAGKPVNPPVQQLQFEKDGLVDISKRTGRPAENIDGKPALSLAGYKAAIEKQLEEIRTTKININKTVQDTTRLTQQINGTKSVAEAVTAEEKGLRGQLTDSHTLRQNAILEEEYLQTPLTNTKVDLEMLKRRQMALEGRLKELAAAVFRP